MTKLEKFEAKISDESVPWLKRHRLRVSRHIGLSRPKGAVVSLVKAFGSNDANVRIDYGPTSDALLFSVKTARALCAVLIEWGFNK